MEVCDTPVKNAEKLSEELQRATCQFDASKQTAESTWSVAKSKCLVSVEKR